jgi:acetylornithine deacetylase/succinyl-diaminopimelate desuccinylase-like protein
MIRIPTQPDYDSIAADALRLLEILCRKPSVSAEGRALEETAALVQELLADSGFETRQMRADEGPPAVYGEQGGRSGYTLLLYNHYDVQPAEELDLWESPPFEPTIRDEKLFARGTADNKGELAVRLAVVRSLLAERGGLPIGIRWIVEGEEEVLSPHFDEIVSRNVEALRADACLWEGGPVRLSDGRPVIGLGFKGSLAVRLDVRLLRGDSHSAAAAVAPSAAWRLVEALSTLRDEQGRVRIPGFYDTVVAPTHAERRVIEEESDAALREIGESLGLEQFLDGLTGPALRERWAFGPTCNIAGIKTGYSGPGMKTVLPAEASAWLDLRLVPDQRPEEVLTLLRAHLQHEGFEDVEVTMLGSANAAGTPVDHPFVRRVSDIAEQVTSRRPSIGVRIPATLPIIASIQRHLGVPGLSAPDNPFYFGAGAHAPNEHVRLEDINHAVRFVYALFDGLERQPPTDTDSGQRVCGGVSRRAR